jgi:4-diphosphocytidyl-2-C-methyl-D-erythritol kinase
MLTIKAPSKINLTLEVLGKRLDGYHDIRSVVQTVSLADRLTFQHADDMKLMSSHKDWLPEKSLISRTVSLLREVTGYKQGALIEVEKHIPLMAGLGGDSSDAATTITGLNQLWKLGLSGNELLALAARLGSDVALFLYGGTALIEGRGERVTPLPPLPHMYVLLAVPTVQRAPGKTGQLYQNLTADHYTDGQITQRIVNTIKTGERFNPSPLFNTFENVAYDFFPRLTEFRDHIMKLGATDIHLAGSGPALFTLTEDKALAESLCQSLRQQSIEAYIVETC